MLLAVAVVFLGPDMYALQIAIAALWGVSAVLYAVVYRKSARYGLTATPRGLTLHRDFRDRHYQWEQITAIYPRKVMFSSQAVIYIRAVAKKTAPAPVHIRLLMPDRDFHEKVRLLQQWHDHYRRTPETT